MYFLERNLFNGQKSVIFSTIRHELEKVHDTTTDSQINHIRSKIFIIQDDKIKPY